MALIAHRMMLRSRSRPTISAHQQLARNKVGVLLVPALADYYNEPNSSQQTHKQTEAATQAQNQIELSPNVCTVNINIESY